MSYNENNKHKSLQRFQSVMHIIMGALYFIGGSLLLYVKSFGTMELPSVVAYALGGLMIVYGIFRLWRGFIAQKQRNAR